MLAVSQFIPVSVGAGKFQVLDRPNVISVTLQKIKKSDKLN